MGSVLHGNDTDASDLDLLVDPMPGATLFDLGGLQDELEELLGVRVDVVTPRDLPECFRAQVLAEANLPESRLTLHLGFQLAAPAGLPPLQSPGAS
jgi:predicted nucleotidyltransferase